MKNKMCPQDFDQVGIEGYFSILVIWKYSNEVNRKLKFVIVINCALC